MKDFVDIAELKVTWPADQENERERYQELQGRVQERKTIYINLTPLNDHDQRKRTIETPSS